MPVSPEAFLAMSREVLGQPAFGRLLGAELSASSPGRAQRELARQSAQGTIVKLG